MNKELLLVKACDWVMVKERVTVELLKKVMVEVVAVGRDAVTVATIRVVVLWVTTTSMEVVKLRVKGCTVVVVVGKVTGTKLVVTLVSVATTGDPCTNVVNGNTYRIRMFLTEVVVRVA